MFELWFALAACFTVTCIEGTTFEGGQCVAVDGDYTGETAQQALDSAPGDIEETGLVEDTGCTPVNIWDVQARPIGSLNLARRLEVQLDAPAGVEVRCTPTSLPDTIAWTTVVPEGSVWRFLDTGIDPGPDWTSADFDDSAWGEGPSPLGFGETLATIVEGGPDDDRHPTVWFRMPFSHEGGPVDSLQLRVRRDDGVAVYLDGVEIVRDALPPGELTPDTLAVTTAADGAETAFYVFDLDPKLLTKGDHILAAEVHQASAVSSDLIFDLAMDSGMLEPATVDEGDHVVIEDAVAPVHEVLVAGLLADAAYSCSVASSCPGETAEIEIGTGPLPSGLPSVSGELSGVPFGAYSLVNVERLCEGDEQMWFIVADVDGRVRWYYELPGVDTISAMDIEAAWSEQRLLFGGGDGEVPKVLGVGHEVIYESDYPGIELDSYHHDILRTPDGTILGLVDRSMADGGSSWLGFGIVEHDPATGLVTWSYHSQSSYDAGTLGRDVGGDPYHANAMILGQDVDGEGAYVNLLYTEDIVRIDRETGDLTWTLGPGEDFTLLDLEGEVSEDWYSGVHSLVLEGTTLWMVDNGISSGRSRVLALDLDIPARTATIVWSWSESGWFDSTWGDVDVLSPERILVTRANRECDHSVQLVEVERSTGAVVSRLTIGDGTSAYRGQRIDGCELFSNTLYCESLDAPR